MRHTNRLTTGARIGAASIALLAGTAAAQTPPAGSVPSPSAVPMPAPKAPGNGKPIVQAGSKPKQDAMRDPLANQGPDTGEKVSVDENMIVDLHVNDEDLVNVLQMLSIQSQKSILTSKNVSATVTANLYGATFYEALDAILHVNGYGYMERGNFIYVYTLDELTKIAEASRNRVWKVLKLNYLNAVDAAEFVKPLLSEGGQIKTNGKTAAYSISENAPTGADDYAHDATMMVFDFEENLAEIEKVVAQMDTKPSQVLVEATILQTALNEANAFGVDFAVLGDLDFIDFLNIGGPLKAVDGLISGNGAANSGGGSGGGGTGGGGSTGRGGVPLPADGKGRAIVSNPGNTSGPATLKLGVVQNDVAAFLRLLDEVSDTTIISRPNILTLNRQPARVLVGRKVGYLNTTSTDTATTQTVEFLDTGTQLYFRPFVSSDGMIRMELKPKVSEAVIRNVTDAGGAAVTIPDEISNELTTNVMVRDGQTIVLGGLFREATTATRRQVPFAGDIPIIGAAFRGHDDKTERSEIIFMITPTIQSDASAVEIAERGKANVERVRAGSREGLLPWSRERRGQQMLVQATDLARDGKRDEALYKIERSLRLNHFQPDAIALREHLMNQKSNWPTRSMQHEIVSGELQKKLGTVKVGAASPSNATTPSTNSGISRSESATPSASGMGNASVNPAASSANAGNDAPSEPPAMTPSTPSSPEPALGNADDPSGDQPDFIGDSNDPRDMTTDESSVGANDTRGSSGLDGAAAAMPSVAGGLSANGASGSSTSDSASGTTPITFAGTRTMSSATSTSNVFFFRGIWGTFRTFAAPANNETSASVTERDGK
ncbi:MAG: hypothetical protein JNM80_05330 [Phycisphaerae bacterium]|nr:hypothetical protein [Phycisphaerae bacterium]